MSSLPDDHKARKAIPVATGFVDYFPDAIAAVAELSRIGNDQHKPGKPLHWDRSKSGDESDALMRHFIQRGTIDTDGVRHSAKVAWRAMALLQKEIEAANGAARSFSWTPGEPWTRVELITNDHLGREWIDHNKSPETPPAVDHGDYIEAICSFGDGPHYPTVESSESIRWDTVVRWRLYTNTSDVVLGY